jgi:hypothetical protein
LTENVAFLIDFDPNLMVCDMDAWPYAVVHNSQKRVPKARLRVATVRKPVEGVCPRLSIVFPFEAL